MLPAARVQPHARVALRRIIGALLLSCLAWALPQPAFADDYPDFERQTLYVPVRDGTRLAVNIYRPSRGGQVAETPLPVIFVFTPYRARYYNESGEIVEAALDDRLALRSLLRAGYVVAVADIRGKGASFGSRRGFQDRTEARDGYDLVEWLARQPYTTGDVGMLGCSYLGGTTLHTASTAPPSLRAVFAGASDWDKYDFVRRGGITAQFNTRPDEPLSDDLASVPVDADTIDTGTGTAMLAEAVAQHGRNTPMAGLWYSMPFRDSVSPLTGNAFWDEVAIWRHAETISKAGIATFLWGNWKDEPTGQVLIAAQNLGSRLLVGPGSHCAAPEGFDFTGEITRYFDFHLKHIDNGFSAQPPVTYWSDNGTAPGAYLQGDDIPGTGLLRASLYLGQGDASLGRSQGRAGATSFTVNYDVASDAYFAFWPETQSANGPVFTTAPFIGQVDLLGSPVAYLKVKADRPDADVFVYLEEVDGAGTAEVLSFGRLKISQRAIAQPPWDNLGQPWHSGLSGDAQDLPAGEVAELAIAMLPLSHRVEQGAQLRFVVTGADPRQRNLAEIAQDPAPQITVLHGWGQASRIELPITGIQDPHFAE